MQRKFFSSFTTFAEHSSLRKFRLCASQKASALRLLSVLLTLFLLAPITAKAKDPGHLLKDAIAVDLSNLDADELSTLQSLFGLANGTRNEYIGGKLTEQDNRDFGDARRNALALLSVEPQDFAGQLESFLNDSAETKGGRAYLADAIPSIEMNAPGSLPNLAHQLFLHRGDYAFTTADSFTVDDLQQVDLGAGNISVADLALLAKNDETRPAVFPVPLGAWNNDAYLVYDENGEDIHIFFQHNPFAQNWNTSIP